MELNHKIFGQGDPIIILHGLFGTLDNWQTIAKRLADDYTVVILDQRNHGKSPHLPTHTYDDLAADLYEFMTAQWMHRAHLIGHSMGGKVAMQFALHYPDMVDKLVVADIGNKAYRGGHEAIFEALFAVPLARLSGRAEAEGILRQHLDNEGEIQFLLKNLARSKTDGFQWKMNLPVLHQFYPNIIGAIENDSPFEGETLFLRGEKSSYVRDSDWSGILDAFPFARLQTVKGAGHWLHADQPDAFVEAVRQFLAKN